jgi:hypothetical protein
MLSVQSYMSIQSQCSLDLYLLQRLQLDFVVLPLSDPLAVEDMYIDVSRDGCIPRFINVRGCSS